MEEKRKKKKGNDMRASKQVKCEDDARILLVCHVVETRERQGSTRFPASVLFVSGVCVPRLALSIQ